MRLLTAHKRCVQGLGHTHRTLAVPSLSVSRTETSAICDHVHPGDNLGVTGWQEKKPGSLGTPEHSQLPSLAAAFLWTCV